MPSKKKHSISCHKCDNVRNELNTLKAMSGYTWRKIAATKRFIGMKHGTLSSIAKGDRCVPDDFKARFGIEHKQPAPVCLVHGVVHCFDCRTQTVKAKVKPREYKDLFAMPKRVLLWKLENKKVVNG